MPSFEINRNPGANIRMLKLSEIFKNIATKKKYTSNYPPHESGKSKATNVQFNL